jgi:hypothetical protein
MSKKRGEVLRKRLEAQRRQLALEADQQPRSFTVRGMGGTLTGTYDPAPALAELKKDLRGDPDAAEKLNRMRELIRDNLIRALDDALMLLARDEVPYLLLSERGEERKQLKDHERRVLRHAAAFSRMRMGIERRGRPAGWTKTKLEKALEKAARAVRRRREPLTMGRVVTEFNKQYGTEKPLTENALKKLLAYHKGEWKNIKSAVTR